MRLRSGQTAIVTIGLLGLAFFGGMVLLKRQLHNAPSVSIPGVVIIPAKVLGAEKMAYLTDAIPATLAALLAHVSGLEVHGPPESAELEHVHGDLERVAGAYQVPVVLTSVIDAEEDELTLNIQIASPASHGVLWSNQYRGPYSRYNELLQQAAAAAGHVLQPESARLTTTTGLAANSEAELAYRQGAYYLTRFKNGHAETDFDTGVAAFKRALQLDPALANAAADIGRMYAVKVDAGESINTILPEVETWATEALRIDPQNAAGYVLLGEVSTYRGNNIEAVRYDLKAAHQESGDSTVQASLGSVAYASEILFMEVERHVRSLDPLGSYPRLNEALILAHLGQTREANTLVDEALQLEPDLPAALATRLQISLMGTSMPEASDLLKKIIAFPADKLRPSTVQFLRDLYALESTPDTERILNKMDMSAGRGARVALALIQIGKIDLARNILIKESDSGFNQPYDFLMLSPGLAQLRNDARFRPLLERSHGKFDDLCAVLEEARSRGELPKYLEQPFQDLLVKLKR